MFTANGTAKRSWQSHFSFLITHFAQRAIGPCPKHDVVVTAVRKAVSAATTIFTAISISRFFFIISHFLILSFSHFLIFSFSHLASGLILSASVVTAAARVSTGASALVLTAVLTGIGAAAVLTSVGSTVPQNSCQTSAAFPLPLPSLP